MSRIGERRHLISVITDADGEVDGKYADELTHFATGIIGPDDASDVVSTAVLRSFTSPSWPGVANHRAYLYRAVLNECRQLDRGRKRRVGREQREARARSIGVLDPEVRLARRRPSGPRPPRRRAQHRALRDRRAELGRRRLLTRSAADPHHGGRAGQARREETAAAASAATVTISSRMASVWAIPTNSTS